MVESRHDAIQHVAHSMQSGSSMSVSVTAARISWLLPNPEEREVYRVHRLRPDPWPAPGGRPAPMTSESCFRCGNGQFTARGMRSAVFFFIRDRHTDCTSVRGGVIHHGCIPEPGKELQRAPARKLPPKQGG